MLPPYMGCCSSLSRLLYGLGPIQDYLGWQCRPTATALARRLTQRSENGANMLVKTVPIDNRVWYFLLRSFVCGVSKCCLRA